MSALSRRKAEFESWTNRTQKNVAVDVFHWLKSDPCLAGEWSFSQDVAYLQQKVGFTVIAPWESGGGGGGGITV